MEYDNISAQGWLISFLLILCVSIICLINANPLAVSTVNILLMALLVAAVVVCVVYWVLTSPTEKRIIRKINKMGYECKLVEGKIVFGRDGLNWRIDTFKVKKRYRRMAFHINFKDDRLDHDHSLTNRLFCIISFRNPSTVINWDGKNRYYCLYETVVTSTQDIEREFNAAIKTMENTIGELTEIFHQAFDGHVTEENHKVGFKLAGAHEDSSTEIRAQSIENTSN